MIPSNIAYSFFVIDKIGDKPPKMLAKIFT